MDKNINIGLIGDHLDEVEGMLESRGLDPEMPIKSLPKLSEKVWGLKPGKLTVVGARTSMGKTSFVLQLAYDLALQGFPVLFMSLEMSKDDLIERIFCNRHKVDNYELLTGGFVQYRNQWIEAKDAFKNLRLSITDCVGHDWKEIEKIINNFDTKPKLVVIDYIQAIRNSSMDFKGVMDEYIRHFRELAHKNKFAGVLCSQINRVKQDSKNKEPRLHHLKGTGYLEEHADIVMLLHWPYKYDINANKNDYQIYIDKNRNGRTGFVKLKFYPEYYRFEDCNVSDEPKENNPKENEKEAVDLFTK